VIRIAVISDTHDWCPLNLLARLQPADEIWHLGDVCDPDILSQLMMLGKPVEVVLGNNEAHALWPLQLRLAREGIKFFLTHIPPAVYPPGTQVVLHGHTHRPRDEIDARGVRWLNPGAINGPRGGSASSFGWLELTKGRPLVWRLEEL